MGRLDSLVLRSGTVGRLRHVPGRMRRGFRRACKRTLGTLVRVDTTEPVAALTFDDGPDPVATPSFLEVLAAYDAKATFFMLGREAAANPDLVRLVHDQGHTIGNHGWEHLPLPEMSWRARRGEVRRCAAALDPYGAPFFRPPYMLQSVASFATVRRLGYEVVGWGIQVEDWLDRPPRWMADQIVRKIKPGCIVLLHDAVRGSSRADRQDDRTATREAVRMVLESLGHCWRFVTVSDLMRFGKPVRLPWFVRHRDYEASVADDSR